MNACSQVCRAFLATLQLANDGNVSIGLDDPHDQSSIRLTLLSQTSTHKEMVSTYVAPSVASATKRPRLTPEPEVPEQPTQASQKPTQASVEAEAADAEAEVGGQRGRRDGAQGRGKGMALVRGKSGKEKENKAVQ